MISILAASVIGTWSYAGFLAEPSPAATLASAPPGVGPDHPRDRR